MTRLHRSGELPVTRTTMVLVTTVPPPVVATTLAAARLAPPLREGPRGGGVTPTSIGAVPQARKRDSVCAMTPQTPGAHRTKSAR